MTTRKQEGNRPRRLHLPLHQIDTDPDTFQFREIKLDHDHVKGLVDAIHHGHELDPMVVWERSEGEYIVLDGHHRHAANTKAQSTKKLAVLVHNCSEAEAALIALADNTKTKLPMSKTERTNAAWRIVSQHPEISKRQTVDATGVGDGTVAKMRRTKTTLEERGEVLPVTWRDAMRTEQGQDNDDWDDEAREQWLTEQARRLDDKIGKDIGLAGHKHLEALASVLDRRLSNTDLRALLEYLGGSASEEEDEEFPF